MMNYEEAWKVVRKRVVGRSLNDGGGCRRVGVMAKSRVFTEA
jgi:hypothetical protein